MSETQVHDDPALMSMQIRSAVKPSEGRLVPYAAQCLLCLHDHEKTGAASVRMETSQLRNFMAACNACDDPRLVQVWVLYQMSRHKEWCSRPGDQGGTDHMFGHQIVGLFTKADGRIHELANSLRLSEHQRREATMQLLRAFAGQLARLHSYVKKDGDWDTIERIANEVKS